MKVYIDAGHNHSGGDTGAEGNGLREQDVTFGIADKLRVLLEGAGLKVRMSRNALEDNVGRTVTESINGRVSMANEWGAELFVSIHCNSGGGTGCEVLVYEHGSEAARVAQRVCDAVCARLGLAKRGVKARPDLGVLRGTACPAVLVETAFLDHAADSAKLRERQAEFAQAIFEGVTGGTSGKGEEVMGQTVQKLDNIWVQEIEPAGFGIAVCDCKKRSVGVSNYFNAGFFAAESGGKTIPVGNLACDGEIVAQAKDNPGWINVAGRKLTTIYTTADGGCGLVKTDDLSGIAGLKCAVSGVPVIVGGKQVSMEEVKAEGYDGSELYETWHGFLGLRHGKLVYVAARCDWGQMCWILVALGIYDAVKLDGGGSFILHNGRELEGTAENRRINNVGMWS